MKVYVAIVQRPMADMDSTRVKAFKWWLDAQEWVDAQLADKDYCEGYSEEEMNWTINEMEVQ